MAFPGEQGATEVLFTMDQIRDAIAEVAKSKPGYKENNVADGRYPKLIMRPVGVQEMKDNSLVLMEFTPAAHPDEIKIKTMRRYQLVPMSEVPLDKQQLQR